jgi:leucyl/phenylalanyl-tRNA---protein transferase
MSSAAPLPTLPWLAPGEAFPLVSTAWDESTPYPGLLCAGGALDVGTLRQAYRQGIFPWFSPGQPVLWWSTTPRLVLQPHRFRFHRSMRKTVQSGLAQGRLEVRMNHATDRVIQACAQTPRAGQSGTWIVPAMVQAYQSWHRQGDVHSVETWWDGELVGGLYAVQIGGMVFGESMFSHQSDASKIALAALVAWALKHQVGMIDCQQATAHLMSMGAHTMDRGDFVQHVARAVHSPAAPWVFGPDDWSFLY